MSVVAMREHNRDRRARAAAALASTTYAGAADHAIAADSVPDIQRARVLAGIVEVAREHGVARVTVAHIVARSGVSRRTFYEFFADREACFLAAMELALERGAARVVSAYEQADDAPAGDEPGLASRAAIAWRERIRAGLRALLEFLDDEPGLGGLCVVDALGAEPSAQERRAEIVRVLVDAVDAGAGEARAGLAPTRMTAEGVVGGVLGVLYSRITERDPRPLSRLLSPLMAMIVLPYMGPSAAAREHARPSPRTRKRSQQPVVNPLEGLDMRLTYRTVRVLSALAELQGGGAHPSNRQVADAAGVHDQGQISKLLVRLERLGLAENAGMARGEPNAWRLTARGGEVERAIREQAGPRGTAAMTGAGSGRRRLRDRRPYDDR